MKKDYIIVAPKYSKSNGVRTLYRLAEELKVRGYNAYVFAPKTEGLKIDFIDHINEEMRENTIIIYPETIYGNPLKFKNVVRYVLYYPGILGGETEYSSQEYVVSFDPIYYPNVDVLSIPCLDTNLFYEDTSIKKDTDCYFVYKGGKWRDIKEFSNMIEINSKYPKTRVELANLLRRTKTLYSYDDCTLLLDEALACGCNVKIIRQEGFEDYKGEKYKELFKNFEEQIEKFINISQSLQYKGKITNRKLEGIPILNKLKYYKHKIKQCIFYYCFNNKQKAISHWHKAESKIRKTRKK